MGMIYLEVVYSKSRFNIYSGERLCVSGGHVWVESDNSQVVHLIFSHQDKASFYVMNKDGTTFKKFTTLDLFSPSEPEV